MKPWTSTLFFVVVALALAGCGDDVVAVRDGEKPATESSAKAGDAKGTATPEQRIARFREMAKGGRDADAMAVPVSSTRVQRGSIESWYHSTTNLTAVEEAVVVARAQGVVEAIFVEEGDVVKEGHRLAQLETERLRLEEARSRTQLESLKAIYERAKKLHDARMNTPDEYDAAKFNYEAEQANLALQEYALREATMRATIDGVITRRHIKVGHTLNVNDPAFEMKRLDRIEATLNVPERETGKIQSGQFARLLVDAMPDAKFEGVVSRVAPEVDPTSGTFRVTVTLDNSDGQLKPGLFARVQLRVDQHDDVLLAPLEAVVVMRDQTSVFAVLDGVVSRRPVETGYVSDGLVEIVTGLREGDEIVMSGQDGLRDGASVKIVADIDSRTSVGYE